MMININEVKNSTLAKLTAEEIGALGLCNYGVGLYKGELKTRYNGMARHTADGVTFWFESRGQRPMDVEFTRIQSDSETPHWAARVFFRQEGRYDELPMGIYGCNFIR